MLKNEKESGGKPKKQFSIGDAIYGVRVKLHEKFADRRKPCDRLNAKERNRKIFYYVMFAFPILQFLIFYIGVNLNSILLAFKSYDYQSGYTFVWFDNFKQVVLDIVRLDYMKLAIRNSLLLSAINLGIGMTFSLLFSFYIYKKKFLSETFRVFLFLPVIVSSLALVIVYRYFCEIAVPNICELVFHKQIDGLLTNYDTQLDVIIVFNVFAGFGIQILMYSSAMSGIPESVVEAAKIDGITPLREFFSITLPLIYPTFVTFFVVTFAGIFTNQMHVFSFFGDKAEYNVYTVGYFLYRQISDVNTGISEYPYLSAFGLVLTLISVPMTLLVKKGLEAVGPKGE